MIDRNIPTSIEPVTISLPVRGDSIEVPMLEFDPCRLRPKGHKLHLELRRLTGIGRKLRAYFPTENDTAARLPSDDMGYVHLGSIGSLGEPAPSHERFDD